MLCARVYRAFKGYGRSRILLANTSPLPPVELWRAKKDDGRWKNVYKRVSLFLYTFSLCILTFKVRGGYRSLVVDVKLDLHCISHCNRFELYWY